MNRGLTSSDAHACLFRWDTLLPAANALNCASLCATGSMAAVDVALEVGGSRLSGTSASDVAYPTLAVMRLSLFNDSERGGAPAVLRALCHACRERRCGRHCQYSLQLSL